MSYLTSSSLLQTKLLTNIKTFMLLFAVKEDDNDRQAYKPKYEKELFCSDKSGTLFKLGPQNYTFLF